MHPSASQRQLNNFATEEFCSSAQIHHPAIRIMAGIDFRAHQESYHVSPCSQLTKTQLTLAGGEVSLITSGVATPIPFPVAAFAHCQSCCLIFGASRCAGVETVQMANLQLELFHPFCVSLEHIVHYFQ